MRILVTGSRDWSDHDRVEQLILRVARGLRPSEVTIVHGGARGADMDAQFTAKVYHFVEEEHPADWQKYGKRAGFVRNAEMVELGADVCLAFIKNGSRGATMTADLAEKAGIPTRRVIA